MSYRELVENAFDFKGLDVLNYIPLDCRYSPSYFLEDPKFSTSSDVAREMHYLCMSYYDPNIEHISGNFLSTLEIYDKKKMLRLVSMYPGLLHLLFVDTKTLHDENFQKVVEFIQGINYERIDIHDNAPFTNTEALYYKVIISELYNTAKIRNDKSNMNKILSFVKSAIISFLRVNGFDNLDNDGLHEKLKLYFSQKLVRPKRTGLFSPEETELLLKYFHISDIRAQIEIDKLSSIFGRLKYYNVGSEEHRAIIGDIMSGLTKVCDPLKDCTLWSEEYHRAIIRDIISMFNEVLNNENFLDNKNEQCIANLVKEIAKEYFIFKHVTNTQFINVIDSLATKNLNDGLMAVLCNLMLDERLDRSWIVNEDALFVNSQFCFESKEDYIDALKNNNLDALLSYEFIDFVIKYPEFANRWNPEIASVAMKRAQQCQFEEPKSQDFQDIDFQQQSVESNNLLQSEEGQMQPQQGGVKIGGDPEFHPSVYDKLVQKNPYRLSRPKSPLAQQQMQKGSDQKVEEDVKNSNIQHSSKQQKQQTDRSDRNCCMLM
ncbi:hypothetical protein [Candidatus Deianiraea vastatrix]|uniref:hypothetical protein n=1 Tax=Candidatus Deianiraea vastatrix TaxID=2163644 RepID=UPI0011BDC9BB|nr:hypothetical protein [Candidatus Deianiraea vastatrix]